VRGNGVGVVALRRLEDAVAAGDTIQAVIRGTAINNDGAEKAGFKSRDMISGAGHDAAYVARVAPTTMIFIPCAGGISHNEAESTSFDECAAGAQVLLNAVLEFDRRLG